MYQTLTAIFFFAFLLTSATGWGKSILWLFYCWHKRQSDDATFLPPPAIRLFLILVLGIGFLSWLGLILGLLHLFYSVTAWLVFALGVGLLFLVHLPAETISPEPKQPLWQWTLAWPLGFMGIANLLYSLFVNALVPPHEWDEVAYHLALSKLYTEAHQIIYVPFIVHSNWPMNTEMLFTWGLLFGSELFAHLVTWGMVVLTTWGIYLVGDSFFSKRIGFLAAVLYTTIPLVIRLSGTGLIDVSLAFYGTATILSYSFYRQERSLVWLGVTGLFTGFAAGSKLMGGAYPLLLGLLIIIDFVRERPVKWNSILIHLSVLGLFGLLMVSPWYGRSYAYTGNPIWPFMFDTFGGGPDWDELGDEYHTQQMMEIWAVDLPVSPEGFLQAFYYLFAKPSKLGGYGGGIGQLTLLLFVLSVVWALIYRQQTPRLIKEFIIFCLLYYLIWFFVVSRQIRFLFTIFPLICLVAAFAFQSLLNHWSTPIIQWTLSGLLLVFLFKDFVGFSSPQRQMVLDRFDVAVGQVSQEVFLTDRVKAWPAYQYVNRELPTDAKVLLVPYENRGYYLDRDYIWGSPVSQRIIPFEQYDDPAVLAEKLKSMGITHILDNPEWLYEDLRYWEHDRALMLNLESRCSETLAQWDDIVLFQLADCQ